MGRHCLPIVGEEIFHSGPLPLAPTATVQLRNPPWTAGPWRSRPAAAHLGGTEKVLHRLPPPPFGPHYLLLLLLLLLLHLSL